jgi:hypothetical protein
MKHKPIRFRGQFRKVFCNCNDEWLRHIENHQPIHCIHESFDRVLKYCRDCALWPWVYVNKTDEPK